MDSLRASLLVRRRRRPRFERLRTYVFVFSHTKGHGTGKKRTGNSARIFLQSFYNCENYPSVGACKRNYLNVNPCDESVTEVHSQPPHKRTLTRKITERSSLKQTKASINLLYHNRSLQCNEMNRARTPYTVPSVG